MLASVNTIFILLLLSSGMKVQMIIFQITEITIQKTKSLIISFLCCSFIYIQEIHTYLGKLLYSHTGIEKSIVLLLWVTPGRERWFFFSSGWFSLVKLLARTKFFDPDSHVIPIKWYYFCPVVYFRKHFNSAA